jgi:riboflavin synthase
MFTGIVESLGEIVDINEELDNIHFTVRSEISPELKIDQSLSHSGVCLTVVDIEKNCHTVTAVKETLDKSALKNLKKGDVFNLERAMKMGGRLDGHLVQGHVDDIAKCVDVKVNEGSWIFTFSFNEKFKNLIIEKGSICINGVSLTVFNVTNNSFDVTIIPYTYDNTNFNKINIGDIVNIEYDMIGKYLARFNNK